MSEFVKLILRRGPRMITEFDPLKVKLAETEEKLTIATEALEKIKPLAGKWSQHKCGSCAADMMPASIYDYCFEALAQIRGDKPDGK